MGLARFAPARSRTVVLVLALASPGCGTTVIDERAGASAAAVAGCAEYAAAACARLARCEPAFLWNSYLDDVGRCEAAEARRCEDRRRAPGTGFTLAWIADCIAASEASTCGAWPVACDLPRGLRAPGERCSDPSQCASGGCTLPAGASCGTCDDARPLGAPCDGAADCGDAVCTKNGCVAFGPPGAACDALHSCAGSSGCVAGVCAPPLAEGDACDPAGDTCDAGRSFVCDATTQRCVAARAAPPGDPCAIVSPTRASCAGGSCDFATGLCVAWRRVGDACDGAGGAPCEPLAGCVHGTCQLPAASTCE